MAFIDFRVQPPWRITDADPETSAGMPGYSRVYGAGYKQGHTYEGLHAELVRLDGRAVVHAEPVHGEASEWNNQVHDTLRRDPSRFVAGFCAGDPRDIMAGVREIERCRHDLDLRGMSVVCDFYNIDLADRRCFPLYAKAAELGMAVALHVGINFTGHSPMQHGHPRHVDDIACHFPELVLVCCHGGWPWATEMAAVAWKHANVYLEFGAVSPKYIAGNGGWGPMNHFMNSVLQDQILFGSDWPMLSHDRLLGEVELLDLKPAVAEKFMHGNAERLLHRMNEGRKSK